MSEFIYDGYAVYQGLTDQARLRTGPDNVSDVLDSLHRLTKAARHQAVPIVMPPSPYMPDTEPGSMTAYEEGEAQGRCDMWAEVKRLNAASPQAEQPNYSGCYFTDRLPVGVVVSDAQAEQEDDYIPEGLAEAVMNSQEMDCVGMAADVLSTVQAEHMLSTATAPDCASDGAGVGAIGHGVMTCAECGQPTKAGKHLCENHCYQMPAPAAPDVAGFPMQPIVLAGKTVRFKENRIVRHLLDYASERGCGLNELARMDFTEDERMQLAQLIGYSVSGYGDLSYASCESVERADSIAEALVAFQNREG